MRLAADPTPSVDIAAERADYHTALAFAIADYDRAETVDEELHHGERVVDLARRMLTAEGVLIP